MASDNSAALGVDLTRDPVAVVMIRLCAPMLVGLIAIMIQSLVIILALGELSITAQATYSVGVPAILMLMAVAIGFSIGCSAKVAQLWNGRTQRLAQQVALNGIIVAVAASSVMALVFVLFIDQIVDLILASSQSIDHLRDPLTDYLQWAFISFPFLGIAMVSNGCMRGAGFSVLPALGMFLFAAINVIFTLALCFGWFGFPALEVYGLGPGTAIANACSAVIVLIILAFIAKLFKGLRPSSSFDIFVRDALSISKISLPAMANQLLPPLSTLIFNYSLVIYGEQILAAAGLMIRIELIIVAPFLAFPAALTAFCGQNYTANREDRLRLAFWWIVWFCIGLTAIWLAALLFEPAIIGLLSDDVVITDAIYQYILIVGVTLAFEGILMGVTGLLNGMGYTFIPLVANLMRVAVVLIPLIVLLRGAYGANGVFAAFALTNVITCVIILISWHFVIRRWQRHLLSEPLAAIKEA